MSPGPGTRSGPGLIRIWPALLLGLLIVALRLPGSWPPGRIAEQPPGQLSAQADGRAATAQTELSPTAGATPGTLARLIELLLPGLFTPVTGVADSRSLMTRALLDGGSGSWDAARPLHVGLTPLMLALSALLMGRGKWPLWGRLILALAALTALGGTPWSRALTLPLAQVSLALLAGSGLASLIERRSPRAEMALAWFALALSAVLLGAAVAAGAGSDAQALSPFLQHLSAHGTAPGHGPGLEPGPAALAASATVLRRVLDHSALAAMAGLCTLLGLLRWRGLPAALLVCAVSAAELLLLSGR